ncbi:hypothetical protein Tco_1082021 [Tanacetum coccineum]|uniref:Uncharacterized protein n=1 Tax=Tanacetum coccineum TaxID=301880 RepID=A0ABQ5I0C7_9ASTR
MSTPAFVDPKGFTQADGAQSSRVPVPLSEDPYEAIRQAYLDGTDIESEPFKDPVETETPESPLTVAPPTSLPESPPPTLVPILCRTARMAVRVPPAMSSGLFASMAEVAAMSEFAFRKRFRSSYESSPSLSPPDLPLRKHYRGTSELVEYSEEDDDEEDDDEEDEEIKESLDSDSVSKDAEDKGPTAEDDDPTAGDEGLATGVEGLNTDDESHGLDDDSHGMDDESHGLDDEGHSVESDGLGLEEEAVPGALRRRELALEEDHVYSTFEVGQGSGFAPESKRPERTPPSPEWTSGSLLISPSPSVVPSPISSPMIPLIVLSPVATPTTAETEGFFTKLGAQVEIQKGLIRDHAVRLEELSHDPFERSLEYKQERVAVTFGAIWRPGKESWAGQTDAQRAALWHAISDMQGENQDLRLQLAEERHARLELAEVVDSMRRRKANMKVIDREWSHGVLERVVVISWEI